MRHAKRGVLFANARLGASARLRANAGLSARAGLLRANARLCPGIRLCPGVRLCARAGLCADAGLRGGTLKSGRTSCRFALQRAEQRHEFSFEGFLFAWLISLTLGGRIVGLPLLILL